MSGGVPSESRVANKNVCGDSMAVAGEVKVHFVDPGIEIEYRRCLFKVEQVV